jgi:hypothetical protein
MAEQRFEHYGLFQLRFLGRYLEMLHQQSAQIIPIIKTTDCELRILIAVLGFLG